MKVAICLLVLVGFVSCQDDDDIQTHLPHFPVDELSDEFRAYEVLPEGCSATSEACVSGGHHHAQRCIRMFYQEKGTQIQECKESNPEIAKANQDWQDASFQWHKALQQCLAGEDAPESIPDDSVYWLFKRETHAHNCDEEDDHTGGEYENGMECWNDFKLHKAKCNHCIKQDAGCADYVACSGRGPQPSDARLANWWRNNAKLGREKKALIKNAKKMLFRCIGQAETRF